MKLYEVVNPTIYDNQLADCGEDVSLSAGHALTPE
jgi:hypothetical protein